MHRLEESSKIDDTCSRENIRSKYSLVDVSLSTDNSPNNNEQFRTIIHRIKLRETYILKHLPTNELDEPKPEGHEKHIKE